MATTKYTHAASTYEGILERAEKGKIRSQTWVKYFKPVLDEDGQEMQFEGSNWDKLLVEASKYAEDKEKLYRHIWAVIDGDNDKLIILNGRHTCNVLFHTVCEVPWGDGSTSDADVYIEANY